MSYTIYQMPSSLWHKNHAVFDKNSVVHREDYCPVYQGSIQEDTGYNGDNADLDDNYNALEALFDVFNLNHPQNYASRSLSSGDVVMIDNGVKAKYYLCCSLGWHELDNY